MLKKLFGIGNNKGKDHLEELGLKFDSMKQAESHFEEYRQQKLKLLETITKERSLFTPNYKAKSLIGLESLYHAVYTANASQLPVSKLEFKELINYYNAAVFIHYGLAEWKVQEGLFAANTYIDGILYAYGSWSNLSYADKIQSKNAARDSLFKEFMAYIPEEEEDKYL